MAAYECLYFCTASGEYPVKEFIDSLDPRSQRKFFYKIEILEEYGPRLPYPHTKYIGRGIHELRFEGIEGAIRVIYFFYGENKIILTNGFIKKTNKTTRRELELAWQRMKLFQNTKGTVE
jgi:phage-related protein